MSMPLSQIEKEALHQKRQKLFSLWDKSYCGSVHQLPQRPRISKPEVSVEAVSDTDEIQKLIQTFFNPDLDRLVLQLR